MHLAKDILLQILTEASERGFVPGKTQLVKLLYLIEIEHVRSQRERLTELHWLFHHYGPYAVELETIFASPEFEKIEFKTQTNKDFISYRVAEKIKSYPPKIEPRVTLIIKRVVGEWKDKSLEELLDYVYFETEPMQAVEKRGDQLDFTIIKKESAQVVIPLKASRETEQKIAELRKRFAPTLKRLGEQRTPARHEGKEYQEAMKAWYEEMNKEFDIDVLKKIFITITRPPYESTKEGN
jgi:hypothetical protein